MSEIKLKKGDKVVMHTCLESKGKNLGKVWTCRTDSFKCEAGIEDKKTVSIKPTV